ncbi:alpha/beta fold hydrolase [uncultured Clostridium sp.]|uniref:alpha/beta fold hydrolase n=1 Tax=uncultured Clostridium sp. TaxID=59620 RepID=UPI00258B76F0|nr:alpha/beta hydrolase [uncultured Clostridium sp.]
MKYFIKTSDNARILVEDLNSDSEKTILFIHGWPLNHTAFEYQLDFFPDKGYRCVAVDLRGFGESDRPYNNYDYDTMASDIKKVIDVLNLKNITLVGHSMGGAISIKYISKYNSHGVSKLCLIGAAVPSWVKTKDFPYGYTQEKVNEFIKDSLSDRPKFLKDVSDQFFFKYISQPMLNWFNSIALNASPWGTFKCLVSLRDERLFDDIEKISLPTLILHGFHDLICPYEFAKYLNEKIKNSTLIPLTESGHGAFIEEKDKVNKSLLNFIEK